MAMPEVFTCSGSVCGTATAKPSSSGSPVGICASRGDDRGAVAGMDHARGLEMIGQKADHFV